MRYGFIFLLLLFLSSCASTPRPVYEFLDSPVASMPDEEVGIIHSEGEGYPGGYITKIERIDAERPLVFEHDEATLIFEADKYRAGVLEESSCEWDWYSNGQCGAICGWPGWSQISLCGYIKLIANQTYSITIAAGTGYLSLNLGWNGHFTLHVKPAHKYRINGTVRYGGFFEASRMDFWITDMTTGERVTAYESLCYSRKPTELTHCTIPPLDKVP